MKKRLLLWVFLYSAGAWFSTGFHHFDEHFQIIEFARYKMGFNTAAELTWEFHEQMRPALQPALACGGLALMEAVGLHDPFHQMFLFRWLTALLSLGAAVLFYNKMAPALTDENHRKWFWYLNLGLWFLVYSRLRFSSEAWSALGMLAGFCLVVGQKAGFRLFSGGLLLGLAFIFRFQAGIFVFALGAWMLFIQKNKMKELVVTLSGIGVALLLGMVTDRWFYGEWTFTPWHYLDLNILQDRASGFGVSPWYQYFLDFLGFGLPPFSLILLLLVLVYPFLYPKSAVSWSVVPFVLLHVVVGHKEARFLFPAVAFVPWMAIAAIGPLRDRWKWTSWLTNSRWAKAFVWVNSLALLIVLLKPAEANMGLYKYLYRNYAGTNTLMLGLNDIPYEHENLQVRFFRDTLWTRQRLDQDPDIDTTGFERTLVIVNKSLPFDRQLLERLVGENERISPLYRDMPGWLSLLEYKGWYSRSNKWQVYRYSPDTTFLNRNHPL